MASLFSIGQLALSTILIGVSDDDDSSFRVRGAARVCLWAFFAVLLLVIFLALAGADFSGSEPFELSTLTWLFVFTTTGLAGAVAMWRAWRLRNRDRSLIEGGVTGQIIYEMNHTNAWTGWVQYGPDGTDLRDPGYSTRSQLKTIWSDISK